MLKVFIGLIITAIGFLLVIYSEWFLRNFGRVAWAEKYLGTEGGTRLFYKFLGLLGIFIGLLIITGLFSSFAEWILSPLIPGK